MRRLALALALIGAPAAAQNVADGESRDQFRICRAALFHHLAASAEQQAVPRAFAEAMLEQVAFVMFETIVNADRDSVDAQRRSLAFVEEFFLNFGRTLGRDGEAMRDVTQRERTLIACQPFIWSLVKARTDQLLVWRERSIDAPPLQPTLKRELESLGARRRQAP